MPTALNIIVCVVLYMFWYADSVIKSVFIYLSPDKTIDAARKGNKFHIEQNFKTLCV